MSLVWIQMPGFDDNERTARAMAETMADSRVRHYYDPFPTHRAGRAFAHGLIAPGRGPAWDIYLFYEKGAIWNEDPPRPAAYAHQLSGGQRADAAHFHTGDDLVEALHAAMHQVSKAKCRQQ